MQQFLDKKQLIRRRKLIRKGIIFSSIFILASLGVFSYGAQFLNYIGMPIWKSKVVVVDSVESLGYVARTKSSVFRENENLAKENNDLRNRMIDYSILQDENEKLKNLLDRIPEKENFTLSSILTKPNNSPYDTIIIDMGSSKGVKSGDVIYADEKIPLGVVTDVYTNTSLVSLYSSPGTITKAFMDGSNTSVDLVGRGGGNFEMIIPNDLVFVVGGTIVLPGMKSEVVAIIDGVISSATDSNKKVILHSPVNIQSLKWVLIKK